MTAMASLMACATLRRHVRVQGGTRTDQPWGSHTVGREGTAARRASTYTGLSQNGEYFRGGEGDQVRNHTPTKLVSPRSVCVFFRPPEGGSTRKEEPLFFARPTFMRPSL